MPERLPCVHREVWMKFNPRRWAGWIGVLVVLLVVWQFILPPKLGGKTTFLTTDGHSMEPILHTGDLALLRKQSSYNVGDVVEFHAKSLNMPLLHRIVSIDGNGITTKGDNNNFTDLDHPTQGNIIGKMVYHKAGGGKYLRYLTSIPVRLGGALLIGWAVFNAARPRNEEDENAPPSGVLGKLGVHRARRKVSSIRETASAMTSGVDMTPASAREAITTSDGSTLVKFFGALLAISVIITGIAFTQPLTTTKDAETIYNFKGKFNYSANAPNSDLIYADNQLQTGDPIYVNLVQDLFVTYTVTLDSPATFKGSGSVEMKAILKGASGWTHPLPIDSTTKFDGGEARVTAVIDLHQMVNLVADASKLTKVRDSQFSVVLTPTTHVDGTLGGARLVSSYSTQLKLTGNATKVTAATSSVGGNDPTATDGKKNTAADASSDGGQGGTLKIPKGVPAKIGALGVGIGVAAVRGIGLTGVVLGLAGLAYAGFRGGFRRRRKAHAEPIVEQTEDLLAAARNQFQEMVSSIDSGDSVMIQVSTLEQLQKLAEANNASVVADSTGTQHTAIIGDQIYVYRRTTSAEARFGADREAAPAVEGSES